MIEMNIPGRENIKIDYIVCDVNGTLTVDGILINGVINVVNKLKDRVNFFMITADTHGKQADISNILGISARILEEGDEAGQKARFIESLDAKRVIAIGQGANDAQMLETAEIGICVLSKEGTAVQTMLSADVVVPDILSAFQLIENPLRLIATLRK